MSTTAHGKARLPSPYWVYVTVKPNRSNGLTKTHFMRVGPAASLEDARKLIEEDRRRMGETFGGLISGITCDGRTYHILKADWKHVEDVAVEEVR
jgi:hypothetical protein